MAALAGGHRHSVGHRLSLGGLRLALLPVRLLRFMLITGFWTPLMLTIYLVTSATVLSVIIGIPLGIWASRNRVAAAS